MQIRQAGFPLRTRTVMSVGVALFGATLVAAYSQVAPTNPAKSPRKQPAVTAPPVPAKTSPKKKPGTETTPTDPGVAPARTISPKAPTEAPSARTLGGIPEYADAWPSEYRPAPADLLLKPLDEKKAEAFAYFSQGLIAEDNSDQEGMLKNYRKALELDPGYAELSVKVAYELARRNDVAGGIQILKDTIKASPKEPLPYIYLSQLYSNYLRKPDLALQYADQALSLAPENFKSHLAVFELHDNAGDKKKAEAVLERALKLNSTEPRYWAEFGEFLQKLYLRDDGSSSPEELKRMNAVYEKLAGIAQNSAGTLLKVADFYVLSKQVKEAIPFYYAVLKLRPDSDDAQINNVREKLARSLIFTGQREEAIALFEQIVKDNPLRFETYEILGELYQQKGDLEKALTNFEHSLLLDASEPQNHLRLADLLRRSQKFEKAVDLLKQAKVKFPDMPYITYGLALALTQARKHLEAVLAFEEARIDAEKRNEEMLDNQFYFAFGAAAEQAGQYEKAAEMLKQSIELDPNKPDAYNYLGYMWVDRGEKLDEAGELIRKALEIDPENGSYLDSLGWYYFKKGNFERALKELLRAQENILREEKKDSAEVLDHIGDTYSKLGKATEALTYWQKAVALPAEDERSKEMAKKITEKIEMAKQKMTSGAPMPEPAKP